MAAKLELAHHSDIRRAFTRSHCAVLHLRLQRHRPAHDSERPRRRLRTRLLGRDNHPIALGLHRLRNSRTTQKRHQRRRRPHLRTCARHRRNPRRSPALRRQNHLQLALLHLHRQSNRARSRLAGAAAERGRSELHLPVLARRWGRCRPFISRKDSDHSTGRGVGAVVVVHGQSADLSL
jgi:hypothetical protein